MKRTLFPSLRVAVWIAILGLVATACGTGVGAGGAAIEYRGASLARADVNEFASVFATLGGDPAAPAPEPTIESIAQSLEFFAVSAAVEDASADEIAAENIAAAETWAATNFPQVDVDTPLYARLVGFWSAREAVPDEDLLLLLEEVNAQQGEQVCASHILVDSEDEAIDLISQIEGGADFAGLAAQFSTDTGSGAQGGSLGCVPQGTYVPEFEEAVWTGADGDLIGPVESQFGFHIISHEGFTDQGLDFAQEEEGLRETVFNERIGDAILGAEVQLDPRYGTWDPEQAIIILPEGAETEGGDLEIPVGQ